LDTLLENDWSVLRFEIVMKEYRRVGYNAM
jgi:hypothetical protein